MDPVQSSPRTLSVSEIVDRLFVAAAIAAACSTFYAASVPAGSFADFVELAAGWLAIGIAWLIAYVVRAARAARRREPLESALSTVSAAVPLIAVGTLLIAASGAPLNVRYWASKSALSELREQMLAHRFTSNADSNTRASDGARWIGWYRVSDWDFSDDRVRFLVGDSGLFDEIGFATFRSSELAVDSHCDRYEHFDGDWYLWTRRF